MIRKNVMRRCAVSFVITTALLGISGCGEKNVDYSLGSGENKESAGDESVTGIRKELGIPADCDQTFAVGDSGISTISVKDDEIDVPDVDGMKKISFEKIQFTPETVQKLVEGILEKDKGIRYRDEYLMTRDEVQQQIDRLNEGLNTGVYGADDVDWVNEQLQDYKQQLSTSPEQLPEVTNYEELHQEYDGQRDGYDCTLSFSEQFQGNDVYITFKQVDSEKNEKIAQVDGAEDILYVSTDDIENFDTTDMDNQCKKSQSEAVSDALNFLNKSGIEGFVDEDVKPCVVEWIGNDDVLDTVLDGYVIVMHRDLAGGRAFSDSIASVDNISTDEGWLRDGVEEITMYVNDSGVFEMFCNIWGDSSSISSQDVTLMSWSDIMGKADEQLADYYKSRPTGFSSVEFNQVSLTYVLTADDSGNLFYEPMWVFEQCETSGGTSGSQSEDSEVSTSDKEIRQLAYIDAVDGHLVDVLNNAEKTGYYN
jgi:hypothetical protein